MAAFMDPLSGLVSIVDTLLTRVEARKTELAARTDVRDALLDLLHLLREWSICASGTNDALELWLRHREGPGQEVAFTQLLRQYDLARNYVPVFGGPATDRPSNRRLARATISDLFFTFAPELEQRFAEVTERRLEQLEKARAGLEAGSANASMLRRLVTSVFPGAAVPRRAAEVDLDALLRSEAELDRLARDVAAFIRQNFKPNNLSVRPRS